MMRTTSSGLNGGSPQGPLHAADVMVPVDPPFTPTARPNENCVVIAPRSWTTLHLSPAAGLQAEFRVDPAPMKSLLRGGLWPTAWLGLQTTGTSRVIRGAPVAGSAPIRHRNSIW